MSAPKAYIFDVFGTLVDWRTSVALIVKQTCSAKQLEVDALAFADFWRGQYAPAMARIRSGDRGYVPLDDLHFENLAATLNHFDLLGEFNEQERWALNSAWERLDPWPDVVPGLEALKARAVVAPCSNGSIALMTRLAKHGGLPWDCILGAEIAKNYKPESAVYLTCCEALRLESGDVMMVAAHNDDLEAAQNCGLQTAFIPRPTEHGERQEKDLEPTGEWTRVVDRVEGLAVD